MRPTDFEHLETLTDREDRERAYADNAIYRHDEPQGTRYTKGTTEIATKRSWQSLDAILRSDASSAAALPTRPMRISRVFTALTIVAGILTVAGTAASAREGLDLQKLNGTGAVLLGGGLATVGFGITAGIFYGKTRRGYENAVDLYNDSLAVRLGLNTPDGQYIPPEGVLVDEEGFIMLDERERALAPGEEAADEAPPAEEPAEATPADAPVEAAPADEPVPPVEVAPPPAEPAPPAEVAPPPVQVPTPGGAAAAPFVDGQALSLHHR
ncbi:MAG: hypothetical protein H6712_04740 [Myxococcales bacterium]|nr:hypothetical protein [Myxococcales bacterium]MCB9713137.1 hypothetical protein [Myxococcales bacterium]